MEIVLVIIDYLLFIPFTVWILNILIFAVGYRFIKTSTHKVNNIEHRYLVLFPAYKEDSVIIDSVSNFLLQKYPKHLFQVIVIADDFKEETLSRLQEYEVKVLIPNYSKRSKAAALKLAMQNVVLDDFDAVVILDADNHVDDDFLIAINSEFSAHKNAIQVRRVAKNQYTDIAYLDGLSEEINNSIFRKGHNSWGFPAALAGSGMAFEIGWFNRTIAKIDAVGEDKELEYYLLKDKQYTTYLDDVYVYDEKVAKSKDLSNQRKRWIAAQVDVFLRLIKDFFLLLESKDWALLDKLIQWSMPPRILLLGWGPLWIIILLLIGKGLVAKWIVLYAIFLLALFFAIPNRYYSLRTCQAILKLPNIFIAILRSFIGLKTARTTFIHTTHGNDDEDNNHRGTKDIS